jgi:hypothetical protein
MDSEVVKDTKIGFISAHNGHMWGSVIKNSYQILSDSDNKEYVRMSVSQNGTELYTLFDRDQVDKVCKHKASWYVNQDGYVMGRPGPIKPKNPVYLHHHVMDFVGSGRGFQKVSVDHINRNRLDNRKQNLRFATCEEQQKNSKGQLEGTKRERKFNARPLPEGIGELPKYVIYYRERYGAFCKTCDACKTCIICETITNVKNCEICRVSRKDCRKERDFFRIEKHPAQNMDPPLYKDEWATSKSMLEYTIQDKLANAKLKLQEMDKAILEHKNKNQA